MEKTHYKKLRDVNYIGAFELMPEDGKTIELVVKITGVKKEELKNAEKNHGLVLHLEGQKPMIVNSVNAKAITKVAGSPFVEDWIGLYLTLYVAKIRAFGENMEALRVKDVAPVIEKASLPEFLPTNKNWQKAIDGVREGKTTLEQALTTIRSAYNLSDDNLILIQDAVK